MIGVGGYFDESVDKRHKCFIMAGYLCQYGINVLLSWRWEEVLRGYNLKYFKGSECDSGMGEFLQFRDDPDNPSAALKEHEKRKLTEIKSKFIDIICEFQSDISGVGAALLLPDFETLVAEDHGALQILGNVPYYVCFQLTLTAAGLPIYRMNQIRPRERQLFVKPIFDSQEEFSGMARILFDKFAQKNPQAASVLLPPVYESDVEYHTLQAADLLACEVRKHVFNEIYDPQRPERISMTRLWPSIHRIFRVDRDALNNIMKSQTPDSIPIKPVIEGGAKGVF